MKDCNEEYICCYSIVVDGKKERKKVCDNIEIKIERSRFLHSTTHTTTHTYNTPCNTPAAVAA